MGSAAVKQQDPECTQYSSSTPSSPRFLDIGQPLQIFPLKDNVQAIYNQLEPFFKQIDQSAWKYRVMEDGSLYYGQLDENGQRSGIGQQHWKQKGHFLEGYWKQDCTYGKVRMIYPNGDIFKGTLFQNLADGPGVYISVNRQIRGFWKLSQLVGIAEEIRKNGIRYKGTFFEGKPDGYGKFYYPDGRLYKGEVEEGKENGMGQMKWKNHTYKGEFKDGYPFGYGKLKQKRKMIASGIVS